MNYRDAFAAITADPRYLANLDWGESRPGHPEGTVRAHIAEIEPNLEALKRKLSEEECWKLKLLIHTHDTVKAESEPGAPITDPKSHASLARAFLATYCNNADLLAMVQYHDEPFELYRQFESKGKYSQERFNALLKAIRDWNVFLAFNIVDGCTAGKSREPLQWLFREVAGKVVSTFTIADIIPTRGKEVRRDKGAGPFQLLMRVPVPWVFVLTYLIGAALEFVWPARLGGDVSGRVTLSVGLVLFALGVVIAGWGLVTFHSARTTTVPGKASSQLVTWGPYRFSRNPMYVGLATAYIGETFLTRQVWPAALLPIVLAYVNWIVIPVEQARLTEVFGAEYATYQRRVRRWL